MNKKLSIIFSFYNEEDVINELCTRLQITINNLLTKKLINDYEVIFVDDNSSDKSVEVIKNFKYLKYKVLTTTRKFGNPECFLAGFKESDGDLLIYLDTDLQDPPELIEKMVQEYYNDTSYDVIHTKRTKRKGETAIKKFISYLGYKYIYDTYKFNLPKNCGDFKLISRKALNEILSLNESNPFLKGIIGFVGYKQKYIEYEREPRHNGGDNSKFKLNSLSLWFNHFDRTLIQFSDFPLKIIFLFGLITSAAFLGYLIFIILRLFLNDYYTVISVIILAFLALSSLILISMGILGLYIYQIHNQTRNRPTYIINQIIDNTK